MSGRLVSALFLGSVATLALGCKAQLGGPGGGGGDDEPFVDAPNNGIDAAVVDSVAADAAVDARLCAGGDDRMTAPDGSCLVLFKTPRPHAEAAAACTQFGAQLAMLKDANVDATARALAGTLDVFIGLTDTATENTFVWSDGTPLVYENFRDGEPNNGNGNYEEDCILINGVRGGEWDDRPCSTVTVSGVYPYMCQF